MFKDTEVNLQNKHHVLYSFFSHISAGLSLKTEIYLFLYVYVVFFCCLVFVLLCFFFFQLNQIYSVTIIHVALLPLAIQLLEQLQSSTNLFFSPFPSLATLEKSVCASRLFCMV